MKNLIDNIKNVGLDIIEANENRYENIKKFIDLCDEILKKIGNKSKYYKDTKETIDVIDLFLKDKSSDVIVIVDLVKCILIKVLFIERNYC